MNKLHYVHENLCTAKKAAELFAGGKAAIYNRKTGMLVIPDIVDGADRESEEFGFRAGNGEWIYGFMDCIVPMEDADKLMADGESLEQYALGCVPAPGTLASIRMGQVSLNNKEEAIEAFEDLFSESPSGWIAEMLSEQEVA